MYRRFFDLDQEARIGIELMRSHQLELLSNVVDWPVMIRRPPLVRSRLTE